MVIVDFVVSPDHCYLRLGDICSTTAKFVPPAGAECMLKGGNQQTVNTRHQCISALEAYGCLSLEVGSPGLCF